jgi:hypothetical protein
LLRLAIDAEGTADFHNFAADDMKALPAAGFAGGD